MPSMTQLIGSLVGLLALAAAGFVVVGRLEAVGAARVEAADQKAVLAQKERDARLSAEIVQRQASQLAELSSKANTVITRIDHAPVSTGCGPVMRDASRGVRQLFEQGGGPPAGSKPAAAVR